MGVIRYVIFSALVMAIAACATEENLFLNFVNRKCIAETEKKQNPVNWEQANILNINIRNGIYDPSETYMKVGEPTILRIANNDNTPRYFVGGGFLDTVAMAQVSVGDAKYDRPCISGVVINAGKKAELRFVPQKAGIYYPEGSPLWILGLQIGKPGFIYVKG